MVRIQHHRAVSPAVRTALRRAFIAGFNFTTLNVPAPAVAVVILTLVLAVPQPAIADSSPVTRRPLNPTSPFSQGPIPGGRTVAVVIDPRDSDRAFTVAENGGVYRSQDGGRSWATGPGATSAPLLLSQGLNRGLTSFNALAMDPFNSNNLLLLVEDDNRVTGSLNGIWRSTDGGLRWAPAGSGAPPCRVRYNLYNDLGYIRFSPDQAGLVYASANCALGISADAGGTWTWISPISSAPVAGIDGLDVLARGLGESNKVYMCLGIPSRSSARSIGVYDPATGITELYPGPASDQGGNCSIAVNPYNQSNVFVATGTSSGTSAGISEGALAAAPNVTWVDLHGPQDLNENGRPAVVQVHINHDSSGRFGLRLYYHDTTFFYFQDCPIMGGCQVGPLLGGLATSHCVDSPGQPWACLPYFHGDMTQIAFDPTNIDACPLLIAGDAGITRILGCGIGAESGSDGIGALQPYEAGFSGQGPTTSILLATQDNSVLWSTDGGRTWKYGGPCDGYRAEMVRTSPTVSVTQCNADHRYNPTLDVIATGGSELPDPPGTPLSGDFSYLHRFAGPGNLTAPVITKSGDLQIELFDPRTNTWAPLGIADYTPPSALKASCSGCAAGSYAIGGRLGIVLPTFYIILPAQKSGGAQQMLCKDAGFGAWQRETGLVNPVRVWASESEPGWAVAYDQAASHEGVYVTRVGCGGWTRDDLASDLVANSGEFGTTGDPYSVNGTPVAGAGFDPGRPGRFALGTSHNGILVSQDYGASWATTHAYPEPNGGAVGIYFDDSGLADGAVEETVVAGWSRGVWAVRFGAGAVVYGGDREVVTGSRLHLRAHLYDESSAGWSGQQLEFVVRGSGGNLTVKPPKLTDGSGFVAVDVAAALPVGAYTVTTQFSGDPAHAAISTRTFLDVVSPGRFR